MGTRVHLRLPLLAATGLGLVTAATIGASGNTPPGQDTGAVTPIQHLVVIFQENVSFDHYFATYPYAVNPPGEPAFAPAHAETPSVNGLGNPALGQSPLLPPNTPNLTQPFRLDRSQFETTDQDHSYSDEQSAADAGLMDMFQEKVGRGTPPNDAGHGKGLVMGYYDGNTVTALWNYAQQFAMSDNSYGTTFGPSSPGAINLASGDTGGVDMTHTVNNPSISSSTSPNADLTADGQGGYSLTSDAQPYWDDCSTRDAVAMSGQNVGDQLN